MGMTQMRKRLLAGLTAWLLVAGVVSPTLSAAKENQPAPPKLKVGDTAPDFKLQYFDRNDLKDVSLSQYRGKKKVVLACYIFAFNGGRTEQMKKFQQKLQNMEGAENEILTI